jgi:hypothetical protein
MYIKDSMTTAFVLSFGLSLSLSGSIGSICPGLTSLLSPWHTLVMSTSRQTVYKPLLDVLAFTLGLTLHYRSSQFAPYRCAQSLAY